MKMNWRQGITKVALLLVTLMFLSGDSMAQVQDQRDTTEVRSGHLDRARNMRGTMIDSVQYVFLVGNVEITRDSINMYCDSAIVIDGNRIHAYGNVIVQKGDSLKIFADSAKYHSDSLRAELEGDVALLYNEDQMWTPHLEYDLENDVAYYYRTAVMLNDSTQVSSKRGYFSTRSSQARFIDSVVVIGKDVTLLADSLDYNTETQYAGFIGPTYIFQKESRIYCEDGYYDVRGKTAEFRQNAVYNDGEKEATADTITYFGEDGRVFMQGNAHYAENDRVIDSDNILFFEETGETVISGNAIFRDSLRYVESDRIDYNRDTEFLSTSGRSVIIEGPQTLAADRIDYDQTTGLGIAWGEVIFNDTSANVILECDTAFLDRETEYVKAFGPTRPLMKSVVELDTLYLTADTLEIIQVIDSIVHLKIDTAWTELRDTFGLDTTYLYEIDTFRQFEGFEDVRLFKGTLQGKCDSLAFDTRDSIFHMLGNPILWSDTTQFIADTITMTMVDGKIDRMNLTKKGMIISEVHGMFYNQIAGKRMTAFMVESELDRLHVSGNAESVYYAQDDSGAFIGVNQVVASEIFFTFEEKQLEGIRLYSQPDGNLIPMNDVDHEAMKLEGFRWLDSVRPKTLDDLF